MNDYLAEARKNIQTHRRKPISVAVTDNGKPVANCSVSIRQRKHEFLFGANCFKAGNCGTPELNTAYDGLFTGIFNYATLPYYWGNYESERGVINSQKLFELINWCDRHGLEKKGHPLHWHEVPPAWLTEDDFHNLEEMIKTRISDIIQLFKNSVKSWDIVNEINRAKKFKDIISRYEVQRGEANVVEMLVKLAHEIDPQAKLLLNECDFSGEYPAMVANLLNRGVRLHALGLQSHMHSGTYPLGEIWEQTQRFATFGLPLHYTEMSILGGHCEGKVNYYSQDGNKWIINPEAEEKQAKEVADMYTLLFGHPAVEAITWWDLADGQWLNAPSGLATKDLKPKPAYDALKNLVKNEWWTDITTKTNANGVCTGDAFLGMYDIAVDYNEKAVAIEHLHSKSAAMDATVYVRV